MSDHAATLADLVRRPSVNPMGRDVSGPEYLEGRITDYLVQRFSAAGMPWARQTVAPGRDNVVARLEATVANAPVVLWDAHQDTVPVDGMTIEPFSPLVRDGRMQGRGACDVKGGMAAMLVALDRLLASDRPRLATVLFSATVNEEFGFSGVKSLVRLWTTPATELPAADGHVRDLVTRRPDMAVVAEPTGLDLVVQHKGAVRWRTRIRGRACHSAFPERGRNAIYPAARAALAIETLAVELLGRHADHPCGPPTLNLGTIRGGAGVNLVPDLVVLEIDRRLVPGESPAAARDEVIRRIAVACGAAEVEHEEPFLESPGLPDGTAEPAAAGWVDRLAVAIRRHGGGAARGAARYGTNASVLAAAGVPTVVFGPGSIEQAHTADEWIALDQVDAAAESLCGMVQQDAPAGGL
jgi:acetylornithine deacetylase/succinyl-diaminopimelate desuccinylase-like protein